MIEHLPAQPPLTRQRAAGIDASSEEIVHFIDDDTVLDPGYFEAIIDVFTRDAERLLGGVGGFVTDQPPHRFRRVDAWLGLDSATEGVVLRSGRNTRIYTEPARTRRRRLVAGLRDVVSPILVCTGAPEPERSAAIATAKTSSSPTACGSTGGL